MLFVASVFVAITSAILSKFERTSSFFLVFVLAFLAGTVSSAHSFDTKVYETVYGYLPSTQTFESGYMHVSFWFSTHNFKYSTFRQISYAFCFFIFFIAILKFTKKPAMFFALYAFVPFLDDATQVRNFMMLSLSILAYSFLINKTKFGFIIAFILLVIATKFQSTAYLYLFGLLAFIISFEKLVKMMRIVMYTVSGLAVILLVLSKTSVVASLIPKLIIFSNRDNYADLLNSYTSTGFSKLSLILILLYILSFVLINKMISYLKTTSDFVSLKNKLHVLYVFFCLGMVGVPMTVASLVFERVIRNSLIIFFVFVSIYVYERIINKKPIAVTNIITIVIVIMFMFSGGYFMNNSNYIGHYAPYMLHFIRD